MIKRKEKYETPHFTFWLTEYEQPDMVEYDIIFSSNRVAPSVSKQQLKDLSEFILSFLGKTQDTVDNNR